MNEPAKFEFEIDREKQSAVTIECKPGGYGLEIEVSNWQTKWLFLVDLFYLGYDNIDFGEPPCEGDGCVQIVAYDPSDQDEEPVKHLRVWPDGRTEVFKA